MTGFKSQFTVMRHLLDFARDAASQHRASFRFSFELVPSIGVVGLYDEQYHAAKTIVPESHATIASVLPDGYKSHVALRISGEVIMHHQCAPRCARKSLLDSRK